MWNTCKNSETLYMLIILSWLIYVRNYCYIFKVVSSASEEEELINDNIIACLKCYLCCSDCRALMSLLDVCCPVWDISTLIQQPDKYIQRSWQRSDTPLVCLSAQEGSSKLKKVSEQEVPVQRGQISQWKFPSRKLQPNENNPSPHWGFLMTSHH